MIDHAAIARMVPHAGDMCLLDRVLDWTPRGIRCAAESHRADANPMRRAGRLGILCGVEYASQAMALHGALCQRSMYPGAMYPGASCQEASCQEASCQGTSCQGASCQGMSSGQEREAVPEIGFLASVRAVTCHTAWLDNLPGPLEVIADRLHGEAGRVMYGFVLRFGARTLLEGRAAVVIGGLVP